MVEVGSLKSQVVAVRVFCIRRVEVALGQGLGDEYTFVSLCVRCICRGPRRPEEDVGSSGTGVVSSCEPPDRSAKN